MSVSVSFIIPVYNAAPYLRKCLDSILAQTLTGYEVILVNNGSTDDGLSICNAYAREHKSFHVLDLAEKGVANARNEGLKAAGGKYICFMDADDFYTADFAAGFYELCEREKLDIIRGFYRFYDETADKLTFGPKKELTYYGKVLSGEEFLVRSIAENANEVVPVTGFFRRDLLLQNDNYFPKGVIFEEDQIVFLKALIGNACRIMQTPTEFYAYRKHPGSATTTFTVKHARDVGFIVEQELALAKTIEDKRVRKAAKCYAGSSFFQMTCIYGRVPRAQRKEIRRISSFSTRLCCSFYAVTKHQRIKNTLFTFCPWIVDVVYELRNRK